MKKLLVLIFIFSLSFLLFASPCFEEVETIVLSTILVRASIPELKLNGVYFSNSDTLIPDKVEYKNSDLSLYSENLSTKPENISFFDNALFYMSQQSPTMIQIKEELKEKNYKRGDCIVSGKIEVESKIDISALDIALTSDFSSISVKANINLVLTSFGNVYSINGVIYVNGDKDRTLTVTSPSIEVNRTRYKVDLEYKMRKV